MVFQSVISERSQHCQSLITAVNSTNQHNLSSLAFHLSKKQWKTIYQDSVKQDSSLNHLILPLDRFDCPTMHFSIQSYPAQRLKAPNFRWNERCCWLAYIELGWKVTMALHKSICPKLSTNYSEWQIMLQLAWLWTSSWNTSTTLSQTHLVVTSKWDSLRANSYKVPKRSAEVSV